MGDFNAGDFLSSAFGDLSRTFTGFAERLNEADRVSQYSSALASMDRAFSTYNRALKEKRWARPANSDEVAGTVAAEAGASGQLTLGQIDEETLAADYDAMLKEQRDFIRQNFRNKRAQEQALQALEMRSVKNYDEAANLWGTAKDHELKAESDRNIRYYREKTELTPDQSIARIQTQLRADVETGLRRADDAAFYLEKESETVRSAWATRTAIEQAKAAKWDTTVADQWLDTHTPFWDLDPVKREAARNLVKSRVAWEQQEQHRLYDAHDDEADLVLESGYLKGVDDVVMLRKLRDTLPAAQFRLEGRMQTWTERLTGRIEYLERVDKPVDDKTHDDWQKANYDRLLTQMVQAKADGVQPNELRQIIDSYNVLFDADGKVIDYRLSGADLQKAYKEFVEPETSDATTRATAWITAFAKEKKLSPTATEDLVASFWNLYKTHPDASEDEMRKAAEALASPIVKQDLARLFDKVGVQAIFGDERVMTAAEQALYDVQERGFTWRSKESQNLAYLQELSGKWLAIAQGRFPAEKIIRAEPDVNGYYGMEGVPLMYNEQGQLYRYIVEGKQAVLQRFATNRAGQRSWETVTAPLPPAPAPAVVRDDAGRIVLPEGTQTFRAPAVPGGQDQDWHRNAAGRWVSALGTLASPRTVATLDALEAKP